MATQTPNRIREEAADPPEVKGGLRTVCVGQQCSVKG